MSKTWHQGSKVLLVKIVFQSRAIIEWCKVLFQRQYICNFFHVNVTQQMLRWTREKMKTGIGEAFCMYFFNFVSSLDVFHRINL